MGMLLQEIEDLLRAPVQRTTFGLTGWVEGAKAVQRAADQMDAEDFRSAVRELLFAITQGQENAIKRLAQEIENHDASR